MNYTCSKCNRTVDVNNGYCPFCGNQSCTITGKERIYLFDRFGRDTNATF